MNRTGLDYYFDLATNTYGNKLIRTGTEFMKDGKLHGPYKDYDFKDGFILIESNFVNGKENGTVRVYCPDGRDKGKLWEIKKNLLGKKIKKTFYCECW